ncbi:peptide/nickel transport system substrate-binding protein [Acetitomaculum ruminis DSM 5522]|uniref:Peptide/nickel transport system substrate-binding protein n=1 Tax=Acetitomaculum ruminis DSM 5522 TaxID=1120918 RepID=A0A1I0XX15_9FIRM|nr:ABC transporter substrate-binding protein [Acetitomaculum ruminis]SFB05605.1 peptide/nickel transport system substrate-binding protein [Acetitomaculum ruminis DSM 5522]
MRNFKKGLAVLLTLSITAMTLMTGCGSNDSGKKDVSTKTETKSEDDSTASTGTKVLTFGDTTFNSENEEANIDPHNTYAGWPCVRYGVGETLFKFNESMELEPWVASEYKNVDELTWKITIKDGVTFSNGKAVDAEAVKACFEDLVKVHERAAGDLAIDTMEADGQVLTIKTTEAKPTLINYLCDPYGAIIDVSEGNADGIVVGTGPFVAKELITDDHINLVKNENYWDGDVKLDEVKVITISDGDALAMSLQNGDIDAAYGMAYASYPLFENDDYTFSSTATSRAFYCQMNYESSVIKDDAVRKAIAMGIDKESFVNTLLSGYGYTAVGAFPEGFSFGGDKVKAEKFDAEGAKKVLEEAGWKDSDGDGIREKDGEKLTIKWLSYPSRQELPLLAESVQASLKEIGIDVQLNVTADHGTVLEDKTAWDVYAAAFVTCGIGDPMYFFSTHCLPSSSKNRGAYNNDELNKLAEKMNQTFDIDERSAIAVDMQQKILDDNAFVFCSFLKMSIISKSNVKGLEAHASDYYEFTADVDIE